MTNPDVTIDTVRRALSGPKPGPTAQFAMSTQPQSQAQDFAFADPPRQSAVLILLYPLDGELAFTLTVRSNSVAHHKGQVSLPGGSWETQDASLARTAIREAEEELGISLAEAELLGDLTSLYIAPSNFELHPFVAQIDHRPAFQPCEAEVAELLEIPVADLLQATLRRTETWVIRGREVQVPFFDLSGYKVWGATAMVLSEFAAMLQPAVERRTRTG